MGDDGTAPVDRGIAQLCTASLHARVCSVHRTRSQFRRFHLLPEVTYRRHLKNLRGMVFLDHLGRASPAYAYPFDHSPSRMAEVGKGFGFQPDARDLDVLVKNISPAAQTLKLSRPPEINNIAATDSRIFAEAGVVAINFRSVAYTTLSRFDGTGVRVLRTELESAVYTDTYNLLCAYVLLVDKALPKAGHPN